MFCHSMALAHENFRYVPVVNLKGEVVMIILRGADELGIGVGAETIRSRVGK
jgi:hypothetical protein